jgi:hypothetical protein
MKKGKAIYIGDSNRDSLPVLNFNNNTKANLDTSCHDCNIDAHRLGRIIYVDGSDRGKFHPYGLEHLLVTVRDDHVRMISDEDFDQI